MPKSQQSPFAVDQPSSLGDGRQESMLLKKNHIGRRFSAPQTPIGLVLNTPHTKTKDLCSNTLSCNNNDVQADLQNTPIHSDDDIQTSSAQAATSVSFSHEQRNGVVIGRSSSNSNMQVSSTPLCDTNNLPIKRYYERAPSAIGQESKLGHSWQRKKRFGRSCSVDLDSKINIFGSEHTVLPMSRSGKDSKNARVASLVKQGSAASLASANGDCTKMNGEPKSRDLSGEMEESRPSSGQKAGRNVADGRRYGHIYPYRQAQSENLANKMKNKNILANVKEKGYARLEEELMKAQKALEMKAEEVDELKGIRERLMKEVSDFTASIFEEVNSQLNEAAISEQQAKKLLKEANTKIEVLTAEVVALKDLVLTSTPSSPNEHLNPQIDTSAKKEKAGKPFWKTHRRSTSHHQFTKESREKAEANEHHSLLKEMDTGAFDEFSRWRLQPTMEFTGQFFTRVHQEDIQPCLNFRNTKLADRLKDSVRSNSLSIEPVSCDLSFPRKCCLSETHKQCNYKIKFEGDDEWFFISQMSRNRIAAVCDFYAYLRYIVQGLVKCSDKDMYAELIRLRGLMAQARLGLI